MIRRLRIPPAWRRFNVSPSQAAPLVAFFAAIVVIALPESIAPRALRVIAALAVALLLGDAAGRALVPGRLGAGVRLALAATMALALPVGMALILTVGGLGIGRLQLVAAALLLGTAFSAIAVWRRTPIAPTFELPGAPRRLIQPALLYLLAAVIAGGAFWLRASATDLVDAHFSSLSLGPGVADDDRIAIQVANHEGTAVRYQVELRVNGRSITTDVATLPDGGTWDYVPHNRVAMGERVEVRLFRSPNLASPYRAVNATVGADW